MISLVGALSLTAGTYFFIEYLYTLLPTDAPAPGRHPAETSPQPVSAQPAPLHPDPVAPSLWPEDHAWGAVEGWTIFGSNGTGCFARKSVADHVDLTLGRERGSGDFVLGMAGQLPRTEDRTLALLFDGTRSWRPYVDARSNTIVGRYRADGNLAEEISRSATLRVSGTTSQVLTVPLAGTRAALAAVDACVRAMASQPADGPTRPSALPDTAFCDDKPPNGRILTKRGGLRKTGHKLTVRNSSQGDAIVKVRHEASGRLAYSFFVHRNEAAGITGIADGRYRLQFAYGDSLLGTCAEFDDPQASEFERSVAFDTKVERKGRTITTYTTDFTATLYAVRDGNAPTSRIGADHFLRD